jgi:hypothetical protein
MGKNDGSKLDEPATAHLESRRRRQQDQAGSRIGLKVKDLPFVAYGGPVPGPGHDRPRGSFESIVVFVVTAHPKLRVGMASLVASLGTTTRPRP